MASLVFDSYLGDVFAGAIAQGDAYKAMVTAAAYVPNKATHTRRSDVANEVSGAGYTAGGKTVVPTFSLNTTDHKMVVTVPAVAWASATLTGRCLICYQSTGTAATDRLVCAVDFGSDVTSTNGEFAVGQSTVSFTIP